MSTCWDVSGLVEQEANYKWAIILALIWNASFAVNVPTFSYYNFASFEMGGHKDTMLQSSHHCACQYMHETFQAGGEGRVNK